MKLLMTVIKYDGDPFVVGGRANPDAILVHVSHKPTPVTTFITTTVPRLKSCYTINTRYTNKPSVFSP
jgi:hypothetical protein